MRIEEEATWNGLFIYFLMSGLFFPSTNEVDWEVR